MTIDIEILQFLHYHPLANREEIAQGLLNTPSPSTMKRLLASAVKNGDVEVVGRLLKTQMYLCVSHIREYNLSERMEISV